MSVGVNKLQNSKVILLAYLVLSSCSTEQRKEEYEQNDEIQEQVSFETVSEPTSDEYIKEVSGIVSLIDSLYIVEGNYTIDTVDWGELKLKKFQFGPEALDLEHLTSYYKYLSFQFLLFDQSESARIQFEKIINEAKTRPREYSHEILFWNLFEKSGSAYILYENMIIYHKRRCNYDERIERPREQEILNFLYNSDFPSDPYFVRMKCGWTKTDII